MKDLCLKLGYKYHTNMLYPSQLHETYIALHTIDWEEMDDIWQYINIKLSIDFGRNK